MESALIGREEHDAVVKVVGEEEEEVELGESEKKSRDFGRSSKSTTTATTNMSWQEMIENLQTVALPDGTQLGMLSACAICDLQGNLWGQSEGFPGIATDEAQKLMELFADPFSHCANGIYIGGTKV